MLRPRRRGVGSPARIWAGPLAPATATDACCCESSAPATQPPAMAPQGRADAANRAAGRCRDGLLQPQLSRPSAAPSRPDQRHSRGRMLCSCGDQACGAVGKHPLTPHGLNDATADSAQLVRWWRRWPEANIGLVTGELADPTDDGKQERATIADGVLRRSPTELAARAEEIRLSSCLGDNCQSSAQTAPVGSEQLRLGGIPLSTVWLAAVGPGGMTARMTS
jgi:Bifunctional DNA primase/polymerase, N-terminal